MRQFVFTIAIILAGVGSSHATTWYGSPSGNDSHGCTNATTDACFSVGTVEAKASPGDIVYMQAGTYVGMGNQSLTKSGSSGNPIIVQGFAPGNSCPTATDNDVWNPLFVAGLASPGTNPAPTANLGTITITIAASYIRVDCLQAGVITFSGTTTNVDVWENYLPDTGSSRWPGAINNHAPGAATSNSTFEKNYIVGAAEGFFLFCTSCTVEYNNVFKNKEYGTSDEEYLTLLGTTNTTVQRNYFHGTNYLDCAGGSSACHNDCLISWGSSSVGASHDNTFTQNVCFNVMDGVIFGDLSGATTYGSYAYEYNWTITNNIMGYDFGSGAGQWAYNANCVVANLGNQAGHVGGVKIIGNDCLTGAIVATVGSQFTIEDNVFPHADHVGSPANNCDPFYKDSTSQFLSEQKNFLYSPNCTVSATKYPNDIINQHPTFVALNDCNQYGHYCYQSATAPMQDLHPASTSPLIGAGATGTGVSVDLYGTTRPSPPAIGAIEPAGTTVCSIGLSATSLSFGNVNVGASSTAQSIKVTNTGTAMCTVTANSFTTGSQFSIGTGSNACSAVSYNLGVGASCSYYVTFTPTSVGAKSDTYTLTDNASPTTQSFTVSGTGTAPSYTYSYCGTGGGYITISTNKVCLVTSPGKNYQPVAVFISAGGSGTPPTISSMGWSGTGTGTWSLISGTRATNTHSGVEADVEMWTPNAQTIGGETAIQVTASSSSSWNVIVYFVPNVNTVDQACELSTQTASYPGTATGCSLVTTQATEFLIEAGFYDMSVSGNPNSPFGYDFTQNPPSFTFSASVTSTGTYHADLTRHNSSYSGTYAVSGVSFYGSSAPAPPTNVVSTAGGGPAQ